MRQLTFFTRIDCHLCGDALRALERVRKDHPFKLQLVDLDVDASPEKRSRYTEEVPVVELNGRKIMKYRVDEVRLRRLLAQP